MGGGGEAEESDGGPGVGGEERVHVGHEHERKDAEGADEKSELAAGVDAVAVLHAEAGEPAAGDGADAGDGVDGDERVFDVVEIEAVVVVEEFGEIEEIEPPDGVGEAFGEAEGPEAAMAEKDGVNWAALSDGSEVDLGLSGSAAKLVVGEDEPEDEPDESHGAGADEGGVPAEAHGNGCDENGSDEGGGVGAGVEETGGEGAFVGGEPLGDGFDGGGEVAGFAEAKQDAGDAEASDTGDEGGADRSASPNEDGDGVAGFGAELVDDAAGEEEADAVGDLERDEDAAVVDVVGGLMGGVDAGDPAHEVQVKERLDEGEDRAVHVVDGGGEEEKTADGPADVGFIGGVCGEARVRQAGGLGRHEGERSR